MSSTLFIPTFLYIKQHTVTGLLYFGKTSQHDPVKYKGSGTVWMRHIKKHGAKHVETLWYCLFLDKKSIMDFAFSFSRENNIINAKENGHKIWANLVEESGIDGTPLGYKRSEENCRNIGDSKRGFRHTDEAKKKISDAHMGMKTTFSDPTKNPAKTPEFKAMMSENNPMHQQEVRDKVSLTTRTKWIESYDEMYEKGRYSDPILRENKSKSKLGDKNPMYGNKSASAHLNNQLFTCKHCGMTTSKGNITRWHNDKCKHKPI